MKAKLAVIVLLAVFAGLAYTSVRKGHDFDDHQCRECHAMTPVKGDRSTLRMTAPVKELCVRCHEDLKEYASHPVEIIPNNTIVPADFPLSWNGKMTCSTCHDIHSREQGLTIKHSSLRRQVTGAAFCGICHTPAASVGKREGNHIMLERVHMKYEQGKSSERIDPVSRQCLGCHDGSLPLNDAVSVGTWRHGVALSKDNPTGSHSIGIKYVKAMRKRGGLHPPSRLDPAIRLVNGRVGCTSCHNIYSKEPRLLAVSYSRLCQECHDK